MTRHQAITLPGIESPDLLGVALPGDELSNVQLFQQNTRAQFSTLTPTSDLSAGRRARKNNQALKTKGNNTAETFKGTQKGDRIDGAGGNDKINGKKGNDTLDGGRGNDVVNGGLGSDGLLGGVGSDRLNGEGGNDLLYGGPGADTLSGGIGDDRLIGGGERDRLDGGPGNDIYVIDNNATYILFDNDNNGDNDGYRIDLQLLAEDTIIEPANAGIDTIQASGTVALPSNIENLVLIGGTSLPLQDPLFDGTQQVNGVDPKLDGSSTYAIGRGNGLDNRLTGNSGNNLLEGQDGEDILNGGAGADYLEGGKGKDILNGDDGDDILVGDGADVLLGNSALVFPDRGNDTLNGGDGNDLFYGGQGSDVLNGGNGDDFLTGHVDRTSIASFLTSFPDSTEKDVLTGGAGADIFVLGSLAENTVFYGGEGFATITDFNPLEGDLFGVVGSTANYRLESKQVLGSATLDTQIIYQGNVIAVVQDNTSAFLSLSFFRLS